MHRLAVLGVWLCSSACAIAQGGGYYPPTYGPPPMTMAPLPGRNWNPAAHWPSAPQSVPPVWAAPVPPPQPQPQLQPMPRATPAPQARTLTQARFAKERDSEQTGDGVINAVCESGEGVFASESAVQNVSYQLVPSVPPVVLTAQAVPIPKITPVMPPRPGPYLVQLVKNEHGDGQACYASAGALVWWMKDQRSPLLLTEDGLPTIGGSGVLPLDGDPRVGGRFVLGRWLNGQQTTALEASGFFMVPREGSIFPQSNGLTKLARPFTDAATGLPDEVVLAIIDPLNLIADQAGGARFEEKTREFYGIELNLRHASCRCPNFNFDWLTGVRLLTLEESLEISTFTQYEDVPAAGVFQDAFITTADSFTTKNRIAAAQVGFVAEWQGGPLMFSFWNKTAVGVNAARARIAGNTTLDGPVLGTSAVPAGVLALSTNSGTFRNEFFTVIPEIGFDVGLQLNRAMRFTAGYSFLYISDVYRPGEQIDSTLNPELIPSLAFPLGSPPPFRPSFPDARTSFWAQGINLQLEVRW